MNYLTNYYKNLCEQLQYKATKLEHLIESIIDDGTGDGGPNDTRFRNRVPPGSIPPPKTPPPTPLYPFNTSEGPMMPPNFPKPRSNVGMPQIDYDDLDRLLRELEQYLLDYDDRHYYPDLFIERLLAWLQGIVGIRVDQLRNMEMKKLLDMVGRQLITQYPNITEQQIKTLNKLLKEWFKRWEKKLRDRHPEFLPMHYF